MHNIYFFDDQPDLNKLFGLFIRIRIARKVTKLIFDNFVTFPILNTPISRLKKDDKQR